MGSPSKNRKTNDTCWFLSVKSASFDRTLRQHFRESEQKQHEQIHVKHDPTKSKVIFSNFLPVVGILYGLPSRI